MKLSKDVLIPVLLVCFVYPIAAGMWWRYFSGHRADPPAIAQTVLPR